MGFCPFCGKQLQPGQPCACQQNQNQQAQPQNQYPNPQYSNQQFPNPQFPNPQFPPQNPYPFPQGGYGQVHKRPGQTMIRVTGILLTVFGSIGLLVTVAALDTLNSVSAFTRAFIPENWEALIYFELIINCLVLAFGIAGIALASKKDKAGVFIGFGATIAALKTIDLLWAVSAFGEHLETATIMGSLASIVLPILYIVGGNKLKQSEY